VRANPSAVTVADLEGRIIAVSQGILDLHGYDSEDQLLGRRVIEFIHPEDRERGAAGLQAVIREQQIREESDYRLLRGDGSTFVAAIDASLVREDSGEPRAFIAVTRDTSERRRNEEALTVERAYLESLFHSAQEAIVMAQNDGRVLRVNPEFTRLFGYEPDEVVGRNLDELIAPEHLKEEAFAITRAAAGGRNQATETSRRRKDGTHIDVSILASPIVIDDRQVAVYAIYRDVSEEKHAIAALKESEERYRTLVEQAGIAVLIDDVDGNFRYFNQQFLGLFGYTAEEMQSQSIGQLVHPDDVERVMGFHEQRLEGMDSPDRYVFRARRKDGAVIHLEVVATPIEEEGQPAGTRCHIWDVSDSIRLGNELERHKDRLEELVDERTVALQKTNAQLLQSQKMEAIGTLAGGIAHDLNNQLTSIQGYAQLVMSEVDPSSPLYLDLRNIQRASARSVEVTRQLLLFSRKQPVNLVPLGLNETIGDMSHMLRRFIREDITIETVLEPGLSAVLADPGNLEQVLMNLVVNARDAMPDGGHLTIRTENVLLDEQAAGEIGGARPGPAVRLSVRDTGIGMDDTTLGHIFEPFFTTKEVGVGTGLGLSVVFGILKQHKGWIDVTSTPGRGTTFAVYFQATACEAMTETFGHVPAELPRGRGEKILLVEDDGGVRRYTAAALGKHGYEVIEAGDADEAMDCFERHEGAFDLVFSDVVMPGRTGIELVEQILSLRSDIRILLCSGYTGEKSRWQSIQDKGYRFLHKPYALPDLLEAVREVLVQE